MSAPFTRILSDVHYTDPGSWVDQLRDLQPLLEGPERVIMNGDTLDTRVHQRPEEILAEVKAFFDHHAANPVFIAGNHDPDISPIDEISLRAGRVWVTHGHVFFDEIAPWSRLAPEIRRRIQAQTGDFPPVGFDSLEKRFRLFRQICQKLSREHDPNQRGTLARWKRIAYALFPPQQIIGILRAWITFPQIVLKVAQEQRPAARVIITGHTHRAGVWRPPDGRVVVNTGAFGPLGGGRLVDVLDDRIVVRDIVRRGSVFHPGPTVTEIALAPEGTSAVSASA